MSKSDIAILEDAGLSQDAISDAAQVVGYFNYINRTADGLGVDLEPEMEWKIQNPPKKELNP